MIDSGGTLGLAMVVWYELHIMRTSLLALVERIAVIEVQTKRPPGEG